MRALLCVALGVIALSAHTGDKRNLKPSKADKEIREMRKLYLEAKKKSLETRALDERLNGIKRTLVGEGRYACCIRGGCRECALESVCACGGNLNQNKGVCGECYAGWQAGRGSFEGIDPKTVTLDPMDMTAEMTEGMSPMVAEAGWWLSGTSQTPRATPMYMTHHRFGSWSLMTMGQGFLVGTQQTGPRGADKLFGANWIMPMLSRRVGPGRLTFRSMVSLEPATVTKRRYPLLFQTGETAFGLPLIDAQHPHSFFMELGASYVLPLSDRTSLSFYGGPRGEPAFGPSAYAHRLSQSENPVAVISHHNTDVTHITSNVVTTGITHRWLTAEASGFYGREPGENRWELDKGKIDSWSWRTTVTPTANWALQYSQARIVEHGDSKFRQSSSATHVRPLDSGHWASTALWSRTRAHHGVANTYLAESTVFHRNNWYWGRAESTDKEEFAARIQAYTAGYARELPRVFPWLSNSIGGQATWFRAPEKLHAAYDGNPMGFQFFVRFRLAQSQGSR